MFLVYFYYICTVLVLFLLLSKFLKLFSSNSDFCLKGMERGQVKKPKYQKHPC